MKNNNSQNEINLSPFSTPESFKNLFHFVEPQNKKYLYLACLISIFLGSLLPSFAIILGLFFNTYTKNSLDDQVNDALILYIVAILIGCLSLTLTCVQKVLWDIIAKSQSV